LDLQEQKYNNGATKQIICGSESSQDDRILQVFDMKKKNEKIGPDNGGYWQLANHQ